jgi:murein DD-endopeptidase MepM/ murein hydrolase activator NlpD
MAGFVISFVPSLIVLTLLLLGCETTLHAEPAPDQRTLQLGRRFCDAFNQERIDDVFATLSVAARAKLPKADIAQFRAGVKRDLGPEQSIVSEEVQHEEGAAIYLRHSRFAPGVFDFSVAFDGADKVIGFRLVPHALGTQAPANHADYQTRSVLRLPFDGKWTVFWGGRTVEQNYHVATRDQHYAYDILIARGNTTHRGDGKSNRDYFVYGLPIVAPGAGVIVSVSDGVAENVPGKMNPAAPAGNYVVIDHENGEYSLLAHLIPGSIKVKPGQHVLAGQLLGQCGNSGNSSEPHLHYHLQDSPRLGDADGLPAQFRDYLADGKRVARGEPTRGQEIETASRATARQ